MAKQDLKDSNSKTETKKPRAKPKVKKIHVESPAEPETLKLTRTKTRSKMVNMDLLYSLVGRLASMERDLRAYRALGSNLHFSRTKIATEIHLLDVHLGRVRRELESHLAQEKAFHSQGEHILRGSQSALSGFIPQFEGEESICAHLEDLDDKFEKETMARGPIKELETLLRSIGSLRSENLSLKVSQQVENGELMETFEATKRASLDVLVRQESQLSRKFSRS